MSIAARTHANRFYCEQHQGNVERIRPVQGQLVDSSFIIEPTSHPNDSVSYRQEEHETVIGLKNSGRLFLSAVSIRCRDHDANQLAINMMCVRGRDEMRLLARSVLKQCWKEILHY